MPMGTENPLLLMGRDFEFYYLQLKKPVGIPKIVGIVGMRVLCNFPMENFRAFFSPGTNLGPFFPVGWRSHRVCDTEVYS